MVDSLIDAARQPFLELAADIHGSLVYLDGGAAEVAELTLGPAFLLGEWTCNHHLGGVPLRQGLSAVHTRSSLFE
jgi:hypothetical protein